MLIDPENLDFHCQSGSPAIEAGMDGYDMGPYSFYPRLKAVSSVQEYQTEYGLKLCWDNPAEMTDGAPAQDLNAIHVYKDGQFAAELANAVPGEEMEYTDSLIAFGDSAEYTFVPVDDSYNPGYIFRTRDIIYDYVVGLNSEYRLLPAYESSYCMPNPFNPVTSINFNIDRSSQVTISIYDIKGRLIKTVLNNAVMHPGAQSVIWNGRAESGSQCSSGMYLYKIDAGGRIITGKMTLLK